MEFSGQKIKFIETTQVKEGVVCDVYEFEDDSSKDLGIVKVSKGLKTPLQKVLSGEKTIEIFKEGVGVLTIIGSDKQERIYTFPGEQAEVEVKIGEIMQWEATEDLTFAEICYPPYKDGRFLNLDTYLQKFIDDFRFQIVDENDVQRSSTWTIKHDEKSVYVFVRSHGGKMKLSFHPIGDADDGNDSQCGLVTDHRNKLKAQGYIVPNRIRWKRPNDKSKIKRGASILFPTDYMTGEVYQFIKENKPKVSFPMAPIGHTVEVSIFFHYMDTNVVEDNLMKYGYTPIFYMTLNSGEVASVAVRQTLFDKNLLPELGTYTGNKLTDVKINSPKFIHATLISNPKDGEPILLCELNGFEIKTE